MAFYYVTTTGTAITGNSHASRDDGTWADNAQCYGSVETALGIAGGGASNTVLLGDGTHLADTIGTVSSAHWGNSITLDSRNEDPTLAHLRFTDLAANAFYMNPVNTSNVNIKNISTGYNGTFVGNGAGNTAGLIYGVGTNLGSVTFTNCLIGDYDINLTVKTGTGTGLILGNASAPASQTPSHAGTGRYFRFIDCQIQNITELTSSAIAFFKGAASAYLSFQGGGIKNCDKAVLLAGGVNYTFFLPENGPSEAMVEFLRSPNTNARHEFHDNNLVSAAPISNCRPFLFTPQTAQHVNINGLDIRRCHMSANVTNGTQGIFAYMWGNYHVGDVYAEDCTKVAGTNGDGGLFMAVNAVNSSLYGLDQQMVDIEAHAIQTRSGAVCFASNEAVADFRRVKAFDCVNNVGVLYSGGTKNCHMESILVVRASTHNTAAVSGVSILSRMNNNAAAATATATKVTTLNNITIVDGLRGLGDCAGIHLSSETDDGEATFGHNATLNNVVSQNGEVLATNDIEVSWLGVTPQPMVVDTVNCNALNGIYDSGQSGVTVNETLTTTARPTFVNSADDDWRILSPQGTGSNVVIPLFDVNNVAFLDPPNFGAFSFFIAGPPTLTTPYADRINLNTNVVSVNLATNIVGETSLTVGWYPAIPSGLSETAGVVSGTVTVPTGTSYCTVTGTNSFGSISDTFQWTTLTTGDPSTGINVPINKV